jgi:ABC-type polysaccharide transport system permease subunit
MMVKKPSGMANSGKWIFYLMLMPAVLLLLVFNYLPMFGLVMAFQDFKPALGLIHSPFVGFKHFVYLFSYDNFLTVFVNTLFFSDKVDSRHNCASSVCAASQRSCSDAL